MEKSLLTKGWTLCKKRLIPLAIGAGIVCGGFFPSLASAIVVEGPQRVLMIDGPDKGNTVETFNIDATQPIKGYDFGFVSSTGAFTSIVSGNNVIGSYTFTGNTVINFAVKDTK